jgi:F-type H+-transporting ATPase subunit gamma
MRAEENGLEVDEARFMTTHVSGIAAAARRIVDFVGRVCTARIVFAAARPGGRPEVTLQTLLPLPAPETAQPPFPPLHHLPGRPLLDRLSDELLLAAVAHALMESLTSENVARLHAMEAAGRNIGNRLDQLRQRERVVRQEEITADLVEVVSGAEAVAAGRTQEGRRGR